MSPTGSVPKLLQAQFLKHYVTFYTSLECWNQPYLIVKENSTQFTWFIACSIMPNIFFLLLQESNVLIAANSQGTIKVSFFKKIPVDQG